MDLRGLQLPGLPQGVVLEEQKTASIDAQTIVINVCQSLRRLETQLDTLIRLQVGNIDSFTVNENIKKFDERRRAENEAAIEAAQMGEVES